MLPFILCETSCLTVNDGILSVFFTSNLVMMSLILFNRIALPVELSIFVPGRGSCKVHVVYVAVLRFEWWEWLSSSYVCMYKTMVNG